MEGKKMRDIKQISVALENRLGRLAHLCKCFADRKINLLAISVAETSEMGVVRFVVDKPAVAVKMLKECCPMTYTVEEVLLVDLPNKPGAIAKVAAKLAAAKVDIKYVYGTAGKAGARSAVVLAVSSIARAKKALGRK